MLSVSVPPETVRLGIAFFMSCSSQIETKVLAEGIALQPPETTCPSKGADLISYDWAQVGTWITIAGGLYPSLISLMIAVAACVVTGWSILSGSGTDTKATDAFGFLFGLVGFSLFGGVVGLLWAGYVTLITLPLVYAFVWSLKLRGSIVWLGAFSGGLVGFVAVLPVTLKLQAIIGTNENWEVILALALGPGLTTVLGQIGGAIGGMRTRDPDRATDWESNSASTAAPLSECSQTSRSGSQGYDEQVEPRFQFSIRDLLWMSFWLSLLLSVIRISGIAWGYALPLLFGWIIYQEGTLLAGKRLVRLVHSRRSARRQLRST